MKTSDQPSPKPCPFCPVGAVYTGQDDWGRPRVTCVSCKLTLPMLLWNSRPIEETLEARVAELVGELDESLERYDRSTSELVQQVDTFAQCRSLEAQENIKLRLERESLRSRVAELERDRERLDWLSCGGALPLISQVGGCWGAFRDGPTNYQWVYGDTLRAAIDAARTTAAP